MWINKQLTWHNQTEPNEYGGITWYNLYPINNFPNHWLYGRVHCLLRPFSNVDWLHLPLCGKYQPALVATGFVWKYGNPHCQCVYIYIYIIIIIIIYIDRYVIIIIIYIYIGLNYIVDQTKCNSLPIKMLDSHLHFWTNPLTTNIPIYSHDRWLNFSSLLITMHIKQSSYYSNSKNTSKSRIPWYLSIKSHRTLLVSHFSASFFLEVLHGNLHGISIVHPWLTSIPQNQWIGLRENRNRKPSIFPFNMGLSG